MLLELDGRTQEETLTELEKAGFSSETWQDIVAYAYGTCCGNPHETHRYLIRKALKDSPVVDHA